MIIMNKLQIKGDKMKYKNEEYGGRRIIFVRGKNGFVFAQTPEISKQYIGLGKNKQEAFNSAKNVIDNFNKINKKIEETKSNLCKYEDLEKDDDVIEEYRLRGKVLRVYSDTDADSPRDWEESNLGIMACSHRKYKLGDEQINSENFSGWSEIKKYLIEEKGAIPEFILPLYLYDHSGITIKTTPFGDRWDSGQVGFIYTTKDKLKEMGTPKDRVLKVLRSEVSTYDDYLTGNIYGYKLFECVKGNWEETDAVWGFYGSDVRENGILDNVGKKGWRRV